MPALNAKASKAAVQERKLRIGRSDAFPWRSVFASGGLSLPKFSEVCEGWRISVNERLKLAAQVDILAYPEFPGKITARLCDPRVKQLLHCGERAVSGLRGCAHTATTPELPLMICV